MCEANVYISRSGREELFMEKVDRVIPGEDHTLFLESIFGERKVVKARIREMELVRHRIVLEEIQEEPLGRDWELWLEPDTDHGHFHPGEEVRLFLYKGHNMQAVDGAGYGHPGAYVVKDGIVREVELNRDHSKLAINLGQETDGLITVYAKEGGERQLYAKVILEIGHHHHQSIESLNLPLEILPYVYSHAHLGDNYQIQVLKAGEPLAGAEVRATYSGSQREYPFRLVTDENGRASVFLTARGNWLFSVSDGHITSTFTLVKSF